jgi:hypothetical protein
MQSAKERVWYSRNICKSNEMLLYAKSLSKIKLNKFACFHEGYWSGPVVLTVVQKITEARRSMDSVGEFDEALFKMLVEQIKVINLVQVEFVLWSGIGVIGIV